MKEHSSYSIIFFDGICVLCNATVKWIIKHDKKNVFKFASLQSDFAKKTLQKYKPLQVIPDSIVLLENNTLYVKSDATFQIAKNLSGVYSYVYIFKFLPKSFRDFIYDFIAKNRYKWFGKKELCTLSNNITHNKLIE